MGSILNNRSTTTEQLTALERTAALADGGRGLKYILLAPNLRSRF